MKTREERRLRRCEASVGFFSCSRCQSKAKEWVTEEIFHTPVTNLCLELGCKTAKYSSSDSITEAWGLINDCPLSFNSRKRSGPGESWQGFSCSDYPAERGRRCCTERGHEVTVCTARSWLKLSKRTILFQMEMRSETWTIYNMLKLSP